MEWLSAFPTEEEIVFSPLTFLQTTGRRQVVELNGMRFTIVEDVLLHKKKLKKH